MKSIPPLLLLAGMVTGVLGLPISLYAFFTSDQRRATREIRKGAAERGWKYRRDRWQGNPTAFQIDGQTESGITWTLASGNSGRYGRGWTAQLTLRVPALGGDTDLALLPREDEFPAAVSIGGAAASSVGAISGALGSAVEFLRHAVELPSGHTGFDTAYRVLVLPRQFSHPFIDHAIAERILARPTGAVASHALLAWRQPYAFEFEARLPGPPDWATVFWLISLAKELIVRVPPPLKAVAPHGFVDRLMDRFL